jgi:hypothetical protein
MEGEYRRAGLASHLCGVQRWQVGGQPRLGEFAVAG